MLQELKSVLAGIESQFPEKLPIVDMLDPHREADLARRTKWG